MSTPQLQRQLVDEVLRLPDPLLDRIIQTTRDELKEELAMEMSQAIIHRLRPSIVRQVQQILFQLYLS